MAEVTAIPEVELHDGVEIPQLGFGVFQVRRRTPGRSSKTRSRPATATSTPPAPTATRGVSARRLAASGIPRDEVFVTTKLWNSQQGYEEALAGFEASLGRLGLDQVDLYLIHWPMPTEDRFVDTWRAFERIHEEGGSRTIGVSNFRIEDLERLEEETSTRPTVNQVELHPWLQQAELRRWHDEHGIATEAWSPLAKGLHLDDETISRDRRRPRQVAPRPGDPPLAHPARQHRLPEIGDAGADPREHRHLRLRAERGGDGADRGPRRPASGPGPTRPTFVSP